MTSPLYLIIIGYLKYVFSHEITKYDLLITYSSSVNLKTFTSSSNEEVVTYFTSQNNDPVNYSKLQLKTTHNLGKGGGAFGRLDFNTFKAYTKYVFSFLY